MTPKKRFLLGGGGALMPVLVSLLAVDIGAALDNDANITTGNMIGITIRYIILFAVGGFVAYLHEDEMKSFKLFELGIAAPALITSLITAQGVVSNPRSADRANVSHSSFSFISSAYAEGDYSSSKQVIIAGNLWGDIIDGASGRVYRDTGSSISKEVNDAGKTIEKATQDAGHEIQKTVDNTKNSENKLLREKAEILRENAFAEAEKAKVAKLKAEALRAVGEEFKRKAEAALAEFESAEAKVVAAEQKIIMLEQSVK